MASLRYILNQRHTPDRATVSHKDIVRFKLGSFMCFVKVFFCYLARILIVNASIINIFATDKIET